MHRRERCVTQGVARPGRASQLAPLGLGLLLGCVLTIAGVTPSHGQRSFRSYSAKKDYWAAMVVEAETGKILIARNATLPRAPASLVKMMTALIVFEAVEAGQASWTEPVRMSRRAASVGGTRVGWSVGESRPLRDITQAMFMASGNDVATALAEHLEGDVARFVDRMNERARALGMSQTDYRSPHGLDGWASSSMTTAQDQCMLARTLLRFPETLEWSSAVSAPLSDGQIIRNTNKLLGRFRGLDGLKTGYTGKAGYCFASTAERDGMRLVCVLLGASSNERRFSETSGLLTEAFSRFQRVPVLAANQDLGHTVHILGGRPSVIRLVAGEPASVVLPIGSRATVRKEIDAPSKTEPPLTDEAVLGHVRVFVGDSLATVIPAVASAPVRRAGFLERLAYRLGLLR